MIIDKILTKNITFVTEHKKHFYKKQKLWTVRAYLLTKVLVEPDNENKQSTVQQ